MESAAEATAIAIDEQWNVMYPSSFELGRKRQVNALYHERRSHSRIGTPPGGEDPPCVQRYYSGLHSFFARQVDIGDIRKFHQPVRRDCALDRRTDGGKDVLLADCGDGLLRDRGRQQETGDRVGWQAACPGMSMP